MIVLYLTLGIGLGLVILNLKQQILKEYIPGRVLDHLIEKKFCHRSSSPRNYSTDPRDAYIIVDLLRRKDYRVSQYEIEKNWVMVPICVIEGHGKMVQAWGETSAHSICLAALKI